MIKKYNHFINESLNNKVKTGVDLIFKEHQELSKIGTELEYSQYLDTIFPNSKMKDVVYHGTDEKNSITSIGFDKSKLRRSKAFNFTADYNIANGIATLSWDDTLTGKEGVISVVLNMEAPVRNDWDKGSRQVKISGDSIIQFNTPEKSDYYVVFESEQIHILGSKQDIERFKKFVDESKNIN